MDGRVTSLDDGERLVIVLYVELIDVDLDLDLDR